MRSNLNLVILEGVLRWPKYDTTDSGYQRFNATLALSKVSSTGRIEYDNIRLVAWGDLAEVLGVFPEGVRLRVTGTLVSRSYKKTCNGCGTPYKAYWYEVLVDNFILVSKHD